LAAGFVSFLGKFATVKHGAKRQHLVYCVKIAWPSACMFDLARIAATGLVGRIDFHESLGSTSDRALTLAAEGETRLPLLVLCEQQTAGRGRGPNRWWSGSGALTFSLALEAPPAQVPAERWPQIALMAGLAVCEALQSLVPRADLRVKWPNDVYLSDRKLCGILSESVPGWRDRLVVGLGINVNNQEPGRPFAAASLIDHDGISRDLTNVLIAVLDHFDLRWRELLDGTFAQVAGAYRERCFLSGKTVTIQQPGEQTITGVCGGIDNCGALRLRTQHGEQGIVAGTVVRWDRKGD
jgi:BirA family transcriptional regulator, biotin operon repressor / biotin---[acetyl-CoA-carboxylase] ligase